MPCVGVCFLFAGWSFNAQSGVRWRNVRHCQHCDNRRLAGFIDGHVATLTSLRARRRGVSAADAATAHDPDRPIIPSSSPVTTRDAHGANSQPPPLRPSRPPQSMLLAVHIRRTDKLTFREAQRHEVTEYVQALERIIYRYDCHSVLRTILVKLTPRQGADSVRSI